MLYVKGLMMNGPVLTSLNLIIILISLSYNSMSVRNKTQENNKVYERSSDFSFNNLEIVLLLYGHMNERNLGFFI